MKSRVPSTASEAPTREQVAAAIDVLPELERLVLSLQLLEGLTPLEAAGALRLTTHDVEKRMATALRLLSQELRAQSALRRAA